MSYEIKNGKRHFSNQPHTEVQSGNFKLLKKYEMGDKVFPKGWVLTLSQSSIRNLEDSGIGKSFTFSFTTTQLKEQKEEENEILSKSKTK